MGYKGNYRLIPILIGIMLFNACGNNKTKEQLDSIDNIYTVQNLISDEVEENPRDYYNCHSEIPLGVGVSAETSKPIFFTSDLAAFALAGPVKEVRCDSLILKYDTDGFLDYFGFNDSVNLLSNVVYDDSYLKEWGVNGWKFEIRGQGRFDIKEERTTYDFLIHYPEGGYDRYIVDSRIRRDFELEKKCPGEKVLRDYIRRSTVGVEYRNFRRRGDYPQPDQFTYSDYKYDIWGNWISRTVKSEHRRTKHEERIISYYPIDCE